MTVKELIEELSKCPPDYPVRVQDSRLGYKLIKHIDEGVLKEIILSW